MVLGLQKFMKEECEGGFEPVSLLELTKLYRCKTGENPVIFYELPSSIYSLNFNSKHVGIVCGGLKTFKKKVEIFINKFSALDVNLKVITEGLRRPYKLSAWIEKQNQKVRTLEKLYSEGFVEFENYERFNGLVLYPAANLVFQTSDKCEFTRAIYGADEYIINEIKKTSCFAVLTNNSNFILTEGAEYCLSSKDLDLDIMTTFNYNKKNLAKYLDISTSQLPILGSLFSSGLFFIKHSFSNKKKIKEMNELVKKLPSGEEILQEKITHCQNILEMNREELSRWIIQLKFFLGSSGFDIMSTSNKNWDEILTVAKVRHTKGVSSFMYEILALQVTYLNMDFSNVLKPMPDSVLLPLRKQLYGILFFEYPYTEISVTEHCYEYCEDIKKAKYICRIVKFQRISHPGLLKMWSQLPFENIQEEKRRVFCQALDEKLSFEDLKDIEEKLLFPFLAMFYLFWKSKIKLQSFEVKILLIQAIIVNDLSEEEIEKYHVNPDIDAIDLSMWFLKTVNHLIFLNFACGEPFSAQKTNLINFFDGNILHHVYNIEKKTELETKKNTWSKEVRRKFQFLKNKLYQTGHKCGFDSKKRNV